MSTNYQLLLSAIPAGATLVLAGLSKKILPSLLAGVFLAALLKSQSLVDMLPTGIDSIVEMLTTKGNLRVLLFLYLFSGLMEVIKNSGGIEAFTHWSEEHLKTKKSVLLTLWGLIPLTFIDCGFRVVSTGSIVGPIARRRGIRAERLAFILNNTASPVTELIPIATTFVAYNIGVIQQGLSGAGHASHDLAYGILLQSIPFEFFSWTILIITLGSIFWGKAPDPNVEKASTKSKEPAGPGKASKPVLPPRIANLLVPILLTIGLSIGLILVRGFINAEPSVGFGQMISASEPGKTMLVALFLSILATALLLRVQGFGIGDFSKDIIAGGNRIMPTLAILALAWPLSALSRDIGFATLVEHSLGAFISYTLIPVTVFLVTGGVTYFIGSSWGATSILMPAALPLAASSHVNVALVVAAVLSGATFGDVTSPVSGMTNMASNVSRADHQTYIKYASPRNFVAAALSAGLFLLAGWLV